ncbi:MAG TPA: response regulator transcription factor [Polyangia bacterium]
MTVRVLLVDDHRILREGLRALLERAPEVTVVGEAADGRTALQLAGELVPDVVIMDIGLPDMGGADVTRKILVICPTVGVVALSMHAEPRYVAEMLQAGALGYVLKDAASDELVRAIASVARRRVFLGSGIADVLVGDYLQLRLLGSAAPGVALTRREREVLQQLADGKTTKEIAAALNVSTKTVETFRRLLMEKLQLDSIAALTKYAIRIGLSSLG